MMSLRVLIVEDEWLIAAALRCQVESHGHEVVGIAATGRQALTACDQQDPDVVLMDVQMPELDGIAATRELMTSRPHPVVIVTGNGSTRAAAADAGAMAYVVKPLLSPLIPGVIAEAQSRFAQYTRVHDEEPDCAAALAAWHVVRQAVTRLMEREELSEEPAFTRLRTAADEAGRSLRAQAEEVVRA